MTNIPRSSQIKGINMLNGARRPNLWRRAGCRLLDCFLIVIWLVHLFLMVNVNIVCLCSLWYHQPISRYCCHHFGLFLWFVLIYFVVPFNGPSSSKRTKKGQSWFTLSQAVVNLRLIMERWEILQSWCVKFMQNPDWTCSWWYRRESLQLWTKLLGPIFQVPCWKLHVHMKGWPCGWIAVFACFCHIFWNVNAKKRVYLTVSHESFPPKYPKMFTVRHCANHAVQNQKRLHITDVRCGAAKSTPQVGIVQWPRYVFTVPTRKWSVISGAMVQPTIKWRRVVTRNPFLWCYFH